MSTRPSESAAVSVVVKERLCACDHAHSAGAYRVEDLCSKGAAVAKVIEEALDKAEEGGFERGLSYAARTFEAKLKEHRESRDLHLRFLGKAPLGENDTGEWKDCDSYSKVVASVIKEIQSLAVERCSKCNHYLNWCECT